MADLGSENVARMLSIFLISCGRRLRLLTQNSPLGNVYVEQDNQLFKLIFFNMLMDPLIRTLPGSVIVHLTLSAMNSRNKVQVSPLGVNLGDIYADLQQPVPGFEMLVSWEEPCSRQSKAALGLHVERTRGIVSEVLLSSQYSQIVRKFMEKVNEISGEETIGEGERVQFKTKQKGIRLGEKVFQRGRVVEVRPDGAKNVRNQVNARDVRKLVDTELMIGVLQTGHTVEPEDLPYPPEIFNQLKGE